MAISPSAARLRQLVTQQTPFFLCLGYAGWGAGQLDAEIETGSWLYTEVDPGILFEVPLEERYERALATLGLTAEMVWMKPLDV